MNAIKKIDIIKISCLKKPKEKSENIIVTVNSKQK